MNERRLDERGCRENGYRRTRAHGSQVQPYSDAGNDGMVLDAEDKQRLLGEERGRAIENILERRHERTKKTKEYL